MSGYEIQVPIRRPILALLLTRLSMHLPESAFAQTEPTLPLFGKPEDS